MTSNDLDQDALYTSFTRNSVGESYCSIVLPRVHQEVRVPLEDLPGLEGKLLPEVADAVRRAAPALPEGNRVGIMVKMSGAPDGLVVDDAGDIVSDWDPAKGRFFEASSIAFDDLMLCVEKGEHEWRYHEFAGQDRCTRCQVLKDGSYL
jgi:hypothetical protein